MKTKQNEHLSALLDDEAGEFERRRHTDELCEDAELGMTLSRYALVGETIRSRQQTVVSGGSFLAGIQTQLEDEPDYNAVMIPAAEQRVLHAGGQSPAADPVEPQSKTADTRVKQSWYGRDGLRYAMAAGVAVAALAGVLVMQNSGTQPHETGDTLAAVQTQTVTSGTDSIVAEPTTNTPTAADSQSQPVAMTRTVATDDTSLSRRMVLAGTGPGRQTADTLKQYVTLHMQYRTSNGIAPSIQAVSYAK